jgi:hypothetical protein
MKAQDLVKKDINREVIDSAPGLAEQFRSARPFRHVQIENFFTPELSTELAGNFPHFDESLAVNEDGIVGNKAVHEKIMHLGPPWKRLDSLVQSGEFLELISEITGIADLQYDPHYFGGGTHENRHGQGLDAHIDFNLHPVTRQHRRLNLIVYLNEEWEDSWGGSMQLHTDPSLPAEQDEVVTISPLFNRCVIFETNEYSWHGFPRVDLPEEKRSLSRRSFALYYYTDSRPEDEVGPEHSTIYVDGRLPDDFEAGLVLDEERLAEIQVLLASRDLHIKRLYDNIKHLTADVNKLNELRIYHEEQQAELKFLRKEFDQLQSEAEQRNTEIQRQADEIDLARGRLQELRGSTSWRVTRPLRKLKEIFSKNS